MPTILEYLNRLDSDAEMQQAHKADPVGEMERFGLSRRQRDAILRGDIKAIAELEGIKSGEVSPIQSPHIHFNIE